MNALCILIFISIEVRVLQNCPTLGLTHLPHYHSATGNVFHQFTDYFRILLFQQRKVDLK